MAEEIASRDLSVLGLFHHADIVVKCIILGLLMASLVCWAMAFEKLIRVWLLNREISTLEASGKTGTLPSVKSHGLVRAVSDAARTEWTEGSHDGTSGEVRDRLEVAMRGATKRQLKGIERGLPFLATLGSAAPFIGLFGTVWGIMNSFTAIAQQKDTSLAVVAPGIAEALFATAIGLAAAIPAVIFYNQITVALGRASDRVTPAIVDLPVRYRVTASGVHTNGYGRPKQRLGDDDNGYKPLAEINVTPFVDVMLVLLIIFMVAAPLMVQGVPLELPKTSASKLGAIKKPMVVSLATDGKLYIRDQEVTRDTLVSKLMEIKSQEGDGIVYVRADRKIPYGDVMELLGRVGESGYARVSLLSQPSPSSTAKN